MADRIFVEVGLTEAPVIMVGGVCYERVGPSEQAPDVFHVEQEFDTCEDCEESSSSEGSSSDSGGSFS